ncbi:MAG: prolipoprotein diacylglyceryl transferase [Nanoarchaeota archaeon]
MFYHNIDPVLLGIGIFQIRYYGLFYAAGFLMLYYLMPYLAKIKGIKFTKDDAADFLVYAIIGVVAGARAGYILFYNLPFYLQNPLDILAVWNGGLSFHGGIIGLAVSTWIFCREKKINFFDLADIIVVPAALALALGRMGNFMNAELFGRITDVSWCIDYSKNVFVQGLPEGCRHPSQIYASLKNLVIFGVLWRIKDRKLPSGFMFWTFVALYGLLRTFIEFFRQPDEQVGFIFQYFTMGQLLSFPLFLIGIYMLYRLKNKFQ